MTISSMRVLPEEELTRVKERFVEDCEMAYDEALTRHRGGGNQEVPMWLWITLAWFASDNVMGWFSSPILFYPLIICLSVAVLLHQLGVLQIIVEASLPQVRRTVNSLLAKSPVVIPFRL